MTQVINLMKTTVQVKTSKGIKEITMKTRGVMPPATKVILDKKTKLKRKRIKKVGVDYCD